MHKNFVVGIDIGYSNLNICMGNQGEAAVTKILPACAVPLEKVTQMLTGKLSDDFFQVIVDGEPWAGGVEPARLNYPMRQLHEDYPKTKQYKALFYTALALCDRPVIDTLITGLPVVHFNDQERVAHLNSLLAGKHQIAPKVEVEVKKVVVVPQPVGGYMDMFMELDENLQEVVSKGRSIVIDPGFYSVDWVTFSRGEMSMEQSGSSTEATSVLLEKATKFIQADYARKIPVEEIETAIRLKEKEIPLCGSLKGFEPYIDMAMRTVPEEALLPLKNSLRGGSGIVGYVFMVGGGANFYKEAAQAIFPDAKVITSSDPVMANAKGFWFLGG